MSTYLIIVLLMVIVYEMCSIGRTLKDKWNSQSEYNRVKIRLLKEIKFHVINHREPTDADRIEGRI